MSTFALSEEHEALREAVRALAEDKIAPRAADIDRTAEFPWDVYEALVKADFHAVHIPEVYRGGRGGGGGRRPGRCACHRRGRQGMCDVPADPGGEQARYDAAAARRVRGGQAALPASG